MLRVDLRRAKEGMALALPVMNPKSPSKVLLKIGFELTQKIITKLRDLQVRFVWVKYPALKSIEGFLNAEGAQVRTEVVEDVVSAFEELQTKSAARLAYDQYERSISKLIDQLISNPRSAVFLGDLADADDKMVRHASSVMYLSLLMGLRLEGYVVHERKHVDPSRAKEVINLGIGAMLHDIGMTTLDESVREAYYQTLNEGDPAYQQHTAEGYQMVRGKLEPSAATVVLNHHQRWDGTGFAGGEFPVLQGKRIHVFARIAAVADVFDLIRRPPNGEERPTVWALRAMLSDALAKKFDPNVLETLVDVVPPYPPGSIVTLSDDRSAVVIDTCRHDPCRPKVQILEDAENLNNPKNGSGEIVALSDLPDSIYVAESDGLDVSKLNFSPKLLPSAREGALVSV
ncbi:HD-GYP domain-containing protein [Mucisphaera sp.]|uniref:HD-GYP domain-containing protein n=1 Tax=Mucisphaera sp. TaxID=2913024 RepID=UPI003D0D7CF8